MGCSPCEPCPRAFRVTHGMACVTRWLLHVGPEPPHYRADATPGFLRCGPRSRMRVVLPRRTGVASRTDAPTQRYNAGNPRSLRMWVIIRHASVLPHTVYRASLQGNTTDLVW